MRADVADYPNAYRPLLVHGSLVRVIRRDVGHPCLFHQSETTKHEKPPEAFPRVDRALCHRFLLIQASQLADIIYFALKNIRTPAYRRRGNPRAC
jgi:hypothetical protein